MVNALEDFVRQTHQSLLSTNAEFCNCQRCQDDVFVHAMNHARPRYVQGEPLGAALTRVALSQDQAKAEIAVVVYEAMRRVAANPRHTTTMRAFHPAGGGAP